MTFYVLGTSITDPNEKTGYTLANQTAAYIGPFCREGIELTYKNTNTGSRDVVFRFAAATERWVSFYMYYGDQGTNNWDHDMWAIVDYATLEPMLALRKEINSSTFRIRYQSAGSLVTSNVTLSGGRHRFDIHFKSDASTGVFTVYLDGVSWFTFSGNTTGTGAGNTADALIFRREGGLNTEKRVFSAVIVSDSDTRNMAFCVDYPNADGAVTDWSGSYLDVDDVGGADGLMLYAAAAGDISTFQFPNLPSAMASLTPLAVDVRISGTVSGTDVVRTVARVGGVNYDEGVNMSTSIRPRDLNAIAPVNPATAAAWTVAEINAAEFGVKAALS